jgi:hypothetical protein
MTTSYDTDPTSDGGIHVPNLCNSCTRLIDGTGMSSESGQAVCTSFPEGIPEDIILFGDDHRTSLGGEEPFELDPAKRDIYDEWLAYMAPKEDGNG